MPVLRLQDNNNTQQNLQNGLQHWAQSIMYDDLEINDITSTNNNSKHQPTSIPSPFSRIALVKTAFAEVAQHGVHALAAYQQIVSDTLDIAEIFFTYEKWRDKIDIIKWDVTKDLNALQQNHLKIYDTLRMFLINDAETYNFDKMNCIYILKYKNTGDIIGATSPSTLFFSTSNDLSAVDIDFGNKRKAFSSIVPLKDRPAIFQNFIYTWTAANNQSRQVNGKTILEFDEIEEYLQAQLPLINRTSTISNLRSDASNMLTKNYVQFRAPDVEILGNPLYNSQDIPKEYLTDDDVLEDTIIRFPFKIKEESFFNGNIQAKSTSSYLLPIKRGFFKYYTLDDLKKNLKINHTGNVAEVELQIGNQIFKKDYKISDGSLIQARFDCALFPNIKFNDEKEAQYRFGLVCDFKDKDNFIAEYIKIDSIIANNSTRHSVRNESRQLNYQMKNYSIEGSNFDYIEINYKGVSSIVIPKFKEISDTNTFTFAVDFGTTNTHIEYKIGTNTEEVFDISKQPNDDKQVHWLHGGEKAMRDVFDEEFIPEYTDGEFKLPMRTALSYGQKVVWHNVYPFEKASFDELYEKRLNYAYNSIITDLKWSDEANNQQQIKVYIESIMYMLRNKVVLNYGKLTNTQIRWFYPESMEINRFNNLKRTWENAYKKYFGPNLNNIIGITESVAPFNYYIRTGDTSNLVTIDIGGGTTDIVVSKGEEIDYITSFRFAANSIFGDGYAEAVLNKNGITRQFFDEIKTELKTGIDNNDDDLFRIFDDMESNRNSADIASFLFSLKDNITVINNGDNLAANANLEYKLLIDTTQEITFILFYTSIIYHLARLMKVKKSEMPDRIVFSGNGSRVIRFFTDDKDFLERYTKLIFEKIYDKKYNSNGLNIILNKDNPKEATCKGGFFADGKQTFRDIFKKNVVLHSNGTDALIEKTEDLVGDDRIQSSYKIIDEEYLQRTVEENRKFLDFFFSLLYFFDDEKFGLNNDSVSIAKKICYNRLDVFAEKGWMQKKKEVNENDLIQETLFFYPLVGILKQLIDAIYKYQEK